MLVSIGLTIQLYSYYFLNLQTSLEGVKAKYYFKMLNTLTLDGSDISDE